MTSPIYESCCDRPPTLAVRATVAAEVLGISERLLSRLTQRGDVPHVRCGRAVIYPIAGLQDWLVRKTQTGKDSSHDSDQQPS